MSVDPNLARRIQALLNVSGRTPEEAAEFLRKAHELLAKHNLDMDEIEGVGGVTRRAEHRVGEQSVIIDGAYNWKKILLGVVADYFFCKAIIVTGTSMVSIIGRADNRQTTHQMYKWIVQQLDNMAVRATARYTPIRRTDPSKQRWRNNYLHGAVTTVSHRLSQMRQEAATQAAADIANNTTSLVVLTQQLVLVTKNENNEHTEQKYGKTHKANLTKNRGRMGLQEGMRDGHNVDLNGPGRHLGNKSSALTGAR